MAEFKLPDVGEGLTEAEIVTWKVKEGDTVAINDIVVEIETAKSLVELPSPFAGVVQKLMVPEGETVPVGTPIIAIGDTAAAPEPVEPAEQTESDPYLGMAEKAGPPRPPPAAEIDLSNPAASGGGEGESLVGRNKADRSAVRRARHAAVPSSAGCRGHPAAAAGLVRARVSPRPTWSTYPTSRPCPRPRRPVSSAADAHAGQAARPQAGQGPRRRPQRRSSAPARTARSPARTCRRPLSGRRLSRPASPVVSTSLDRAGERETREPIKGVRKMMGQAMVGSAFSIPHVTEWVTLDVTRTMEFVDRLKGRREFRDVKVSPLLVLARAVMLAMRRTPEINSWWDDAAQEVVYKSYVNLGIAAATPRGLVVPNVKDAEQLSLHDLAAALNALTATARDGKTQPAEMSGGTFTITNVGVFGVDSGTPIINPGESAILCLRRDQAAAVGGGRRDRRTPGDDAGAELRPPPHRRREGLALPGRRRRHPRGPRQRPAVLTRRLGRDHRLTGDPVHFSAVATPWKCKKCHCRGAEVTDEFPTDDGAAAAARLSRRARWARRRPSSHWWNSGVRSWPDCWLHQAARVSRSWLVKRWLRGHAAASRQNVSSPSRCRIVSHIRAGM